MPTDPYAALGCCTDGRTPFVSRRTVLEVEILLGPTNSILNSCRCIIQVPVARYKQSRRR